MRGERLSQTCKLVAQLKVEKRADIGHQAKREEKMLVIKLCDSERAEGGEATRQVCWPLCSWSCLAEEKVVMMSGPMRSKRLACKWQMTET